jgi:hypothetical protein
MTAPRSAPTHNAVQRFPFTSTDATVEKVSRLQEPSNKDVVMKAFSQRFGSVISAVAVIASLALATPVAAAVQSFGKTYTVSATIKGGKNLTVLLVSGTGRLLASQAVKTGSQKITLKAKGTGAIGGTTLQLVSGKNASAKGKYYGPVVLGNKGTTAAKSNIVYTKLKQAASTKVNLGNVTIKPVAGTQQGYATTSAKSSAADTSTSSSVRAYKGKPVGVGTYGKTANATVTKSGVWATAVGDPCAPAGSPTCDPSGHEMPPGGQQGGTPNGQQGGTPGGTPNGQQGGTTAVDKDQTLGGDADDDGIPNAFDVNDDGDATVDSADSSTPTPKVAIEGTNNCSTIDFRIFTNFKATERNYTGTINAYGTTGTPFNATPTRSGEVISSTMTMVFQPIVSVCGSNVTASYLKGDGVAYAPTDYVKLPTPCESTKDYQWEIGAGRMCPTQAGNASGFTFGPGFAFAGNNLPSGQDTFTMKVETADNNTYEFTSSPGFVFVTHPMLVSYDNGAGATGNLPYGQANIAPIPVTSDKELTLTMFRPQRLAFDGEPGFAEGAYYDLANFTYTPDLPNGIRTTLDPTSPSTTSLGKCDLLKALDTGLANDTRVDIAAKPMLTVKWNIKDCFTRTNTAWPTAGGYLDIDIQVMPTGPGGNSAQKLYLQLLPA